MYLNVNNEVYLIQQLWKQTWLVVYDIDAENTKQILSAKEQEVFVDIPLMTPSATFITNGVESCCKSDA